MRTFFSKATEDGHGRLLSCFHNLLLFHWEIWQIAGLIVCRNTQAQSRHICRGLASASSTTEQSQLCLNKFGLIRKALPASLTPWEICQPVSRTDIRGIQRTVNSKRLMCACNARQCSDSSEDLLITDTLHTNISHLGLLQGRYGKKWIQALILSLWKLPSAKKHSRLSIEATIKSTIKPLSIQYIATRKWDDFHCITG